MNSIKSMLQWVLLGVAAACGIAVLAATPSPSDYTELNDIPGDAYMMDAGEVIEFVTNFVGHSVMISNGWLIVDGKAVNIAEPTKEVVETNIVGNVTNITTHVYPVVYQDNLTNYATIVRMTVTTNGEEIVTNKTPVAYLDDIPPDAAKADKVISVCEYQNDTYSVLLKRTLLPEAPYSAWHYASAPDAETHIEFDLVFTNQTWTCTFRNGDAVSVSSITGTPLQASLSFPVSTGLGSLDFTKVNQIDNVFVVYTDMLADATNGVAQNLDSLFVNRTNMTALAKTIKEDQLLTVNGIASILANMRSELIAIGGGSFLRFTVTGITNGSVVTLGNIVPHANGDFIDIDWGDGQKERITVPTDTIIQHRYVNPERNTYEITIEGFVRAISGNAAPVPSPFISGANLTDVVIGSNVGLSEFGDYCFYQCTGLQSLKFIPDNIPKFGASCFEGCSGITSLAGMPSLVTEIPARCFANSGLTSLAGMTHNVTSIGDYAFADTLGFSSLAGMSAFVTDWGEGCFANTGVQNLNGLPSTIQTLAPRMFEGCDSFELSSISATSVTNIGDFAFASCSIVSGDMSSSVLTSIGEGAFSNVVNLATSFSLPATCTDIGVNAFAVAYSSAEKPVVVEDTSLLIAVITNSSSFGWGMSLVDGYSRINGLDGYLTSNGTGWDFHSQTTLLTLALPAGSTELALGTISSPSSVAVDWGDSEPMGIRAAPQTRANPRSHTYELDTPSTVVVKIYGRMDSFAATSTAYPFIRILASNDPLGNPYLTEFKVGDAVGLSSVGEFSFADCPNLANIRGLPESLTSLGDSCFTGCTALVSIDGLASTSVTGLSARCFSGCTNISTLAPLSGLSGLRSLGDECFKNTDSIKSLDGVPSSLESLGSGCFSRTWNRSGGLTNINALSSTQITKIPDYCFSGCGEIEGEVDISKIKEIGAYGMSGCGKIARLDVSTVERFGNRCFTRLGQDLPVQNDGFIEFKALIESNQTFGELADALALDGNNISDLPEYDTNGGVKIVAKDGYELAYDNTFHRWEPLTVAVQVSLANITNGTTLAVASDGTVPATNTVAFIWNWGDGTLAKKDGSKWLTDSPPSNHTYQNGGKSNYLITVKGFVRQITASPVDWPWIIDYHENSPEVGNAFITGYTIPEKSPVTVVGRYAFAGCTNMMEINVIPAQRKRELPKLPTKRATPDSRLSSLSKMGNGNISFGEGIFSSSGVAALSGINPSVEVIPEEAFWGCKNLTSLDTLPSGQIREIRDSAFRESAVSSMLGWPNELTWIAPNCFDSCMNLTSLNSINGRVNVIGDYGFANCTNLNTLEGMDDGVTVLGDGAFSNIGISNLVGLTRSISRIPRDGFSYNVKLETLEGFPLNVGEIGDRGFFGCSSLRDGAAIPHSVTNLGADSLAFCRNLTDIELSPNLEKIGDFAFDYTGVDLPESTNEIGDIYHAIANAKQSRCDRIAQLLNNSANTNTALTVRCRDGIVRYNEKIGEWEQIKNTIDITLKGVSQYHYYKVTGNFVYFSNSRILIDWGDGSELKDIESAHFYAKSGDYTVSIIGYFTKVSCDETNFPLIQHQSADGDNSQIAAVTVGAITQCRELGDYCFRNCPNLKTFEARNSGLQILGKECFAGDVALTDLEGLPESLTEFGPSCFAGCNSLKSISGMPESVSVISTNCFANCIGLETVSNLPFSVTTIRSGAFSGCTNLMAVGLDYCNPSLTLEDSVYKGCTSLKDLRGYKVISETIPPKTFKGCVNLRSLEGMPEIVTSIGTSAFEGCSSLTALDGITPSLIELGDKSFMNCSLKNLGAITNSVSYFGAYCFATNTTLTSLGRGLEESTNLIVMSDGCFSGCRILGRESDFHGLPTNTTYCGTAAFSGCDMRNLLHIPPGLVCVATNLFTHTSLTNLSMGLLHPAYVVTDAFSEEQSVIRIPNPFNPDITRIIAFPTYSVRTIHETKLFPWGAASTTMFRGSDGIIVYVDEAWCLLYNAVSFDVLTPGIQACVELKGITTVDDLGYFVFWGNGNKNEWVHDSDVLTNFYQKAGGNTIHIYGDLLSLGVEGQQTPVISQIGNTCTAYLQGIGFTSSSYLRSIGPNAFADSTGLVYCDPLPFTVTNMGANAFKGCSALESVTFQNTEDTPLTLGTNLFAGCTSLTNIVMSIPGATEIPNGFADGCTLWNPPPSLYSNPNIGSIGVRAFGDNIGIKGLDLSEYVSLSNIAEYAFAGCSNLEYLIFPARRIDFATNCFMGVGQSVETKFFRDENSVVPFKTMIRIPGTTVLELSSNPGLGKDGMWKAPTNSLFSCRDGYVAYDITMEKWYQLSVPLRIRILATGSTVGLRKLKPRDGSMIFITWDASHTETVSAFTDVIYHTYDTTSAEPIEITITGDLESISGDSESEPCLIGGDVLSVSVGYMDELGDYAFAGCSNIVRDVRIGHIERIGMSCFKGCDKVPSFHLPVSLTNVGDYAFSYCGSLTNIVADSYRWPFSTNSLIESPLLNTIIATNTIEHYVGQTPQDRYGLPDGCRIEVWDGSFQNNLYRSEAVCVELSPDVNCDSLFLSFPDFCTGPEVVTNVEDIVNLLKPGVEVINPAIAEKLYDTSIFKNTEVKTNEIKYIQGYNPISVYWDNGEVSTYRYGIYTEALKAGYDPYSGKLVQEGSVCYTGNKYSDDYFQKFQPQKQYINPLGINASTSVFNHRWGTTTTPYVKLGGTDYYLLWQDQSAITYTDYSAFLDYDYRSNPRETFRQSNPVSPRATQTYTVRTTTTFPLYKDNEDVVQSLNLRDSNLRGMIKYDFADKQGWPYGKPKHIRIKGMKRLQGRMGIASSSFKGDEDIDLPHLSVASGLVWTNKVWERWDASSREYITYTSRVQRIDQSIVRKIRLDEGANVLGVSACAFAYMPEPPELPKQFSYMREYCFAYSAATGTNWPSYNTAVPEYAYYGATNFTSLRGMTGNTLQNTPSQIMPFAFANTALESLEGMPTTITNLGVGCFALSPLKTLSGLSPNVKRLNSSTFLGNTNLIHVIPDTVETLCQQFTDTTGGIATLGNPSLDLSAGNPPYAIYENGPCIVMPDKAYPTLMYRDNYASTMTNIYLKPLITSVIEVASPNTEIALGYMKLWKDDAPAVVDWGDGEREAILSATYPHHTYGTAGSYTITICGFISEIGPFKDSAEHIGPFVSDMRSLDGNGWYHGDMLTTNRFTDAVGIQTIHDFTYTNCPNLQLIKCDRSRPEGIRYKRRNVSREGLNRNGDWVPNDSRFTTKYIMPYGGYFTAQIRSMPGVPWGYEGPISWVLGMDGEWLNGTNDVIITDMEPASEDVYISQCTLTGAGRYMFGDTVVLKLHSPKTNKYVRTWIHELSGRTNMIAGTGDTYSFRIFPWRGGKYTAVVINGKPPHSLYPIRSDATIKYQNVKNGDQVRVVWEPKVDTFMFWGDESEGMDAYEWAEEGMGLVTNDHTYVFSDNEFHEATITFEGKLSFLQCYPYTNQTCRISEMDLTDSDLEDISIRSDMTEEELNIPLFGYKQTIDRITYPSGLKTLSNAYISLTQPDYGELPSTMTTIGWNAFAPAGDAMNLVIRGNPTIHRRSIRPVTHQAKLPYTYPEGARGYIFQDKNHSSNDYIYYPDYSGQTFNLLQTFPIIHMDFPDKTGESILSKQGFPFIYNLQEDYIDSISAYQFLLWSGKKGNSSWLPSFCYTMFSTPTSDIVLRFGSISVPGYQTGWHIVPKIK